MQPIFRSLVVGGLFLMGLRTVVAAAEDFSRRGPALVGHREAQIPRANGTECRTLIYYPVQEAGSTRKIAAVHAPYPVVVFTSPAMPMAVYTQTLSHIASWGFIAMAPTDGRELLPDESAVADDMRLCLDYLECEHQRPDSPFFDRVDVSQSGFTGHSWGGACSIVAASREKRRVKVVVSLACWSKSTPSAEECVGNLACPLIMLAGDQDQRTPLPSVESIYDTAAFAKTMIVLRGGTHFKFIDLWVPVPSNTSISHHEQLAITRHYLTLAMLVHLRHREDLRSMLWNSDTPTDGKVVQIVGDQRK